MTDSCFGKDIRRTHFVDDLTMFYDMVVLDIASCDSAVSVDHHLACSACETLLGFSCRQPQRVHSQSMSCVSSWCCALARANGMSPELRHPSTSWPNIVLLRRPPGTIHDCVPASGRGPRLSRHSLFVLFFFLFFSSSSFSSILPGSETGIVEHTKGSVHPSLCAQNPVSGQRLQKRAICT